MSEDGKQDDGGTTEGEGTVTKEVMDAAIAEAVKTAVAETTTNVWGKFQSEKDKEVAGIRSKAEEAVKGFADLQDREEAAKLEAMTPEQQGAYYAKKAYDLAKNAGSSDGKGAGSESPNPIGGTGTGQPGSDLGGSPAGQVDAKAIFEAGLKDAGIDPETVDLENGVAGFIKSVAAAAKSDGKTDEEKAAERNEQKAKDDANNTVVKGPVAQANPDLLKMSPVDIIRGGKTESPWTPRN
ncbi:hypothetical protein LCGC14_0423270 [marine sediment metagenome]|uniref:Uncharacterized protein n=1 Tax=marine sediment metagenome TaxID=412755 RepID=A0A0F9SW81_9ZZZZ